MSNDFPDRIKLSDNSLSLVIFVMGVQFNSRFNWLSRYFVKNSMQAIFHELEHKKPEGYLAYEYVSGKSSLLLLYWRDHDQLIRYARNKSSQHFPVWYQFNTKISKMSAIGFWHEIYQLTAGNYFGLYKNCQPSGLGKFMAVDRVKGARLKSC